MEKSPKATLLAYLAGAIDSDGSIGIKKSTYAIRVRGDARNAVYSERIMLKQITPQVPLLLKETFGGYLSVQGPGTRNSKPMHSWQCTDRNAAHAAKLLLPFLRIKNEQARVILELRSTKEVGPHMHMGYWFGMEHPDWREGELLTVDEANELLGYTNRGSISQALKNGTLIGLPYDYSGVSRPRFPRLLVQQLADFCSRNGEVQADGRASRSTKPPQLYAWRDRLYQRVRELNKTGIEGTPTYHLTGYHTPAAV